MKYYSALFLLFITFSLNAQFNPEDIYINAKTDELISISVNSVAVPDIVDFPDNYDILDFDPNTSNGQYILNFKSPAGYTGNLSTTIKYFAPGPIPGFLIPAYTTVHYKVKETRIAPVNDKLLVIASQSVLYDVLSNDSHSDGLLSISRLGWTEGGSAQIVDNKISFSFDSNEDHGFVRYFTEDGMGNTESGSVNFTRLDNSLVEDRTVFVNNKSSIDLLLNSGSFVLNSVPSLGTLSQNGHIWSYDPHNEMSGTEVLNFTSSDGGNINYTIEVVSKFLNTSFVRDDQYFVATNGSLVFNVFENDYSSDFNIIDHSPELTHMGNGEFSFSPDIDFNGDLSFFYKIYANFQFHTGNITIHVDEFAPNQNLNYSFSTIQNHDIVFNHTAPFQDYYFETVVHPSHGTLTIIDNGNAIVLDCDVISGDNKIIYTPDTDFNGTDEFDLRYCTTTGICEIIKVDVNVLDSNYDECLCLSSCVYEGDFNDDGIVDIKDALQLGLNLGQSGAERTEDFDLFWTGQTADDWGFNQMNSSIDLKCGDANGDGFTDHLDYIDFNEHYGAMHNFVPNNVGQLSAMPITFVPQSTEVDSGEWLYLDVYIGSSAQPALDFYGSAFTFNINANIMDSSSVNFVYDKSSWLSHQSPVYDFVKVPADGQIDVSISRINNIGIDGLGFIGTLEFIVEEEVEGLKGNQIIPSFDIQMMDILSLDDKGQYHVHPNQEAIIAFKQDLVDKEKILASSLQLYPNPSPGIVQLEAGSFNIDRIEVYNTLGQQLIQTSSLASSRSSLDLSAFDNGMYLVKVYSQGVSVTRKVFVK